MSRTRDQVVVNSQVETERIATDLAGDLVAGSMILVSGDLGAGKTVFVRGLAAGLGIDADEVTSPTFTLVHEYRGGRLPLIHVDLYRLSKTELEEIGLDSELAGRGVIAIEWPERLIRLPPGAIQIRINDKGATRREIVVLKPDTRPPTPSGN